MAKLTPAQSAHLKRNRKAFEALTGSTVEEYFADHAYIPDLYQRVCDDLGLRPVAAPGIWVHGAPARDLEQVESYLSGDAHDRSKVEWFDGSRFRPLVIEEPRRVTSGDFSQQGSERCGDDGFGPGQFGQL